MGGRAGHWDDAYQSRGLSGVSWYQTVPTMSLELVRQLGVGRTAAVIDVGGGASTLVDHLVCEGFTDLSVLDISEVALQAAKERLGPSAQVSWLCQDLLCWVPARRFGLWHDRAVFHFLTA
ncbi:MAG TPA: class I SAM-dependent methyltransferase, partial [Acidimicrobiales bacterium]|nr:class I SAM-dependent methyltransferase [Acidimicrobiales bacterium]